MKNVRSVQTPQYSDGFILSRRVVAECRFCCSKDFVERRVPVHPAYERVGGHRNSLTFAGRGVLQYVPTPTAIVVRTQVDVRAQPRAQGSDSVPCAAFVWIGIAFRHVRPIRLPSAKTRAERRRRSGEPKRGSAVAAQHRAWRCPPCQGASLRVVHRDQLRRGRTSGHSPRSQWG